MDEVHPSKEREALGRSLHYVPLLSQIQPNFPFGRVFKATKWLIKRIIMSENIVKEKSFAFAIRIVHLYKFLVTKKKEFVIAKQLLRSGTSE